MTPQGSPQPPLARKCFAAGAAGAAVLSVDSDDDWCHLQRSSPQATWHTSEGTPEPQRGRSGSPLPPPPKHVSLPPTLTEPETADDSWMQEGDDVDQIDIDERLEQADFAEYCVAAGHSLVEITSDCAEIIAEADKELQKVIQRPAPYVHGRRMKKRAKDLFYQKLIARVRELDYFCPDASDPVVQELCKDDTMSKKVTPAQAIKYIERTLRKDARQAPQHRQYAPGGTVQLPSQPPRSSARYGRVAVKYGLKTGASGASTTLPELKAALAECKKVVEATRMARPRAAEQALRGGAAAGAANTVIRAATDRLRMEVLAEIEADFGEEVIARGRPCCLM